MVTTMRFVVIQVTHLIDGDLAEALAGSSTTVFNWSSLEPMFGLALYLLLSAVAIFAGFWLYRKLVKVTSLKLVKN